MSEQSMEAIPDYGLLGADGERAVTSGLTRAQWYRTSIDRDQLKRLSVKRDWPALRDTGIWIGSMLLLASAAVVYWPTPWAWIFLLVYGVLYGSASDSRWHECGHGSAFRTPWLNTAVYQLACFMIMRNPVVWRWSHTRHHMETIIVGRDPEIAMMRPPDLVRVALNFLGVLDAITALKSMVRNALGRLSLEEASYIPEREHARVIFIARVWFLIYALVLGLSIFTASVLPLLLVGLPRLYGAWHHILTGLLQHGGLADNVVDYRLNTRTVYMNPFSRFVYWNMNYHTEHHMFPSVPYHALPALHALLKHDLPEPDKSMFRAYKRMLPVLLKQLKNRAVFIERPLPATAAPYRRWKSDSL